VHPKLGLSDHNAGPILAPCALSCSFLAEFARTLSLLPLHASDCLRPDASRLGQGKVEY
jgi:hypothetical protein